MKTSHKDKIVVVGAGNVGEAIAYTLMIRKQASDIVLIDLNEARAKGDALDISHGTSFYNQVTIRQGGYEECADADITSLLRALPESRDRPDWIWQRSTYPS